MPIPDITQTETWALLENEPGTVLIDVRTDGEWDGIGIPDVSSLGREMRLVQWITQPGSVPNDNFLAEASEGLALDTPIVLLCRSGVRSQAAGTVMAEAGFSRAYNIIGGFEGSAQASGWKTNLPWTTREP
jgi:rhodanese-related sulfurtransferase